MDVCGVWCGLEGHSFYWAQGLGEVALRLVHA